MEVPFLLFGLQLFGLWIIRGFFSKKIVAIFLQLGLSYSQSVLMYALLMFPGVLIHEIAHFLSAALLNLRTGSITLIPELHKGGSVEFGSVQVEQKDPIRMLLVGISPLFVGIILVIWLGDMIVSRFVLLGIDWLLVLLSILLVHISVHMFPSSKDLAVWPAMVAISLLGLTLIISGLVVMPLVKTPESVLTIISRVVMALWIPISFLLALTIILFLAQRILNFGQQLRHRRVQ